MLLCRYNWFKYPENLFDKATHFCENTIERKHPIITLPIKILRIFECVATGIALFPFVYAYKVIIDAIDGLQSYLRFMLNFLTNNALNNNISNSNSRSRSTNSGFIPSAQDKEIVLEEILKKISVLNYWKLCGKSLYEYLTDKNDARLAIKIPVVFLGCSLLLLSVLLETVRQVLSAFAALVCTACFAPYLATIALFYGPIYLVDNCAEKFKAQSNEQSSINDDDAERSLIRACDAQALIRDLHTQSLIPDDCDEQSLRHTLYSGYFECSVVHGACHITKK